MTGPFKIPGCYRSALVSELKEAARPDAPGSWRADPIVLDFERVCFKVARFFGFCFGVKNAIEIAYRALDENPERRVYLLSEMIHNQQVNADLKKRGLQFIIAPGGRQLVSFESLAPDDVVIIPAFGTTVELIAQLSKAGIDAVRYNATCPFVQKVWRRAQHLGKAGFSVVIHGKHSHEETKATFSHAALVGPSIIIFDLEEARMLARHIGGERTAAEFERDFGGRYSHQFDVHRHLARIGVVNQTTMLASETQQVSAVLREAIRRRYGENEAESRFADTRDTLCYATTQNQNAVSRLVESGGDLALVVGGYNSSNTAHLARLCQQAVRTFHIQDATDLLDCDRIRHMAAGRIVTTSPWLPEVSGKLRVLLTAGASSPDSLLDQVIRKVAELLGIRPAEISSHHAPGI